MLKFFLKNCSVRSKKLHKLKLKEIKKILEKFKPRNLSTYNDFVCTTDEAEPELVKWHPFQLSYTSN